MRGAEGEAERHVCPESFCCGVFDCWKAGCAWKCMYGSRWGNIQTLVFLGWGDEAKPPRGWQILLAVEVSTDRLLLPWRRHRMNRSTGTTWAELPNGSACPDKGQSTKAPSAAVDAAVHALLGPGRAWLASEQTSAASPSSLSPSPSLNLENGEPTPSACPSRNRSPERAEARRRASARRLSIGRGNLLCSRPS